jgi:hypothetical protein
MDRNGLREHDGASRRQPYQVPTLKVIELATDEVLGAGCKTSSDNVSGALCIEAPCGGSVGS